MTFEVNWEVVKVLRVAHLEVELRAPLMSNAAAGIACYLFALIGGDMRRFESSV